MSNTNTRAALAVGVLWGALVFAIASFGGCAFWNPPAPEPAPAATATPRPIPTLTVGEGYLEDWAP